MSFRKSTRQYHKTDQIVNDGHGGIAANGVVSMYVVLRKVCENV
jgi:hypothetical protein